MLVTPDGEWVFPDSAEFLAALGDPNPDYDAEAFAVKNMGFIKFSVIEHTIIEMELYPRNAELAALLAVQQRLQTATVGLFRIRYFDDTQWQSEITSSAEHAIIRLSQLSAPALVATSRDRFIVEPQGFGQLLKDEDNPLRLMAQKWRALFGRFDTSLIPFAIEHQVMPHMIIMGVKPRRPDPVFRFIGDAHADWLGSRYRFNAIGDKMENFPDKDYGFWASEYYKNVARTGEPRYDHVTATMHHGPTPYFTRYERLMLPWGTGSDETLVTMFSTRLLDDPKLAKYAGSDNPLERNSAKSA
jgi:hypothetical protein